MVVLQSVACRPKSGNSNPGLIQISRGYRRQRAEVWLSPSEFTQTLIMLQRNRYFAVQQNHTGISNSASNPAGSNFGETAARRSFSVSWLLRCKESACDAVNAQIHRSGADKATAIGAKRKSFSKRRGEGHHGRRLDSSTAYSSSVSGQARESCLHGSERGQSAMAVPTALRGELFSMHWVY